MEIREITSIDFENLQELYLHLHETKKLELSDDVRNLWHSIVDNTGYHILVGEIEGKLVSSVTMIVIPNVTRGARPYAVIENVVTHKEFRNKGYAKSLMQEALKIAVISGCYKVMLMTGSKEESVFRFYESCGFNRHDKTAFYKQL